MPTPKEQVKELVGVLKEVHSLLIRAGFVASSLIPTDQLQDRYKATRVVGAALDKYDRRRKP